MVNTSVSAVHCCISPSGTKKKIRHQGQHHFPSCAADFDDVLSSAKEHNGLRTLQTRIIAPCRRARKEVIGAFFSRSVGLNASQPKVDFWLRLDGRLQVACERVGICGAFAGTPSRDCAVRPRCCIAFSNVNFATWIACGQAFRCLASSASASSVPQCERCGVDDKLPVRSKRVRTPLFDTCTRLLATRRSSVVLVSFLTYTMDG